MASLRDRLREARNAARAEKTLTLPLPGWDGPRLFVRYRPMEWDRLAKQLRDTSNNVRRRLEMNVDALVAACDAILVQEDSDEAPVSLAERARAEGDDVVGEVRFDAQAIDLLGLTVVGEDGIERAPESARETCLAAFDGAVSPELSVLDHAGRLGAWMAGVDDEDGDSTEG